MFLQPGEMPRKILLVGHSCSPRRGSEAACTWNWAWHLSAGNDVTVVTHPAEREAIEKFLCEHPNPNLRFIWVTPPRWRDPRGSYAVFRPSLSAIDRRLHGTLHYLMWQRAVIRRTARLHLECAFDVAHHVSWGTVSRPPLLWRLPMPFVWGPVGGGQVAPPAFLPYFGSWRHRELLRTAYVRLAPLRPALRKAVRCSAMVLATNRETAHMMKSHGGHVRLFLDSGIDGRFIPGQAPSREPRREIQFLWAGKLEPRKCLPLALEAFSRVREFSFRLLVAGGGPFLHEWQSLTRHLGLEDRVRFLGALPHAEMPTLYRSVDAFIFTSLQDSFGSQVLEAMAAALPVIALDHQGVGTFLPTGAGIKVPVTTPEQTLVGIAEAIRRVAGSYELRQRLGRAAWEYAKTQTWESRARAMCQLYEEAAALAKDPASRRGETLADSACP